MKDQKQLPWFQLKGFCPAIACYLQSDKCKHVGWTDTNSVVTTVWILKSATLNKRKNIHITGIYFKKNPAPSNQRRLKYRKWILEIYYFTLRTKNRIVDKKRVESNPSAVLKSLATVSQIINENIVEVKGIRQKKTCVIFATSSK